MKPTHSEGHLHHSQSTHGPTLVILCYITLGQCYFVNVIVRSNIHFFFNLGSFVPIYQHVYEIRIQLLQYMCWSTFA